MSRMLFSCKGCPMRTSVPRIPVIFVSGRDDIGNPSAVREQIQTATPSAVAVVKPVSQLVKFCEEAIVPDLVVFTNLNNEGVETIPIIMRLRELGIQVVVMVSSLTEKAARSIGGVHTIRKPAPWRSLIETVIRALPATA
ncbi:MAG: hypothetical protein UY34_C0006G0012 [Parcubacteria group bacterium GW2011_GWA2_48_9]|nr:MAG: hypothetical protein UY34_C0006G0012 [Parcubacteria group bacterium GW2011_GWA2_48_9]